MKFCFVSMLTVLFGISVFSQPSSPAPTPIQVKLPPHGIPTEPIKPPYPATSSSLLTPEIAEAEARFNQITGESGKYFKQGLLNMEDNRRPQAGDDFNKSVEVFLFSGVNVSRNQKLQNCFNVLIETIYQIEFPSDKILSFRIRALSDVCGWKWNENDYTRSDKVAKLVLTTPTGANNALVNNTGNLIEPKKGFNETKFEASPLDELAKLELTPEESDLDTPVAKLSAGSKPAQLSDGKVPAVIDYFNENFDDPYSMRFVRWSSLEKELFKREYVWAVRVKFRAKNTFNAYVLSEMLFYIKANKVIGTKKIS